MISLRGVGKSFSESWIFKDVFLEVSKGESVVLIGPSGSGKSVLMKMIAGLIPLNTGTITLASTDVGMLFQKNALFDSLTVEENLYFPLRERRKLSSNDARSRVKKFLNAVGLSHCETLFPDEISGGMQKRLGIARALIVEPEIILYDEPTAGLDPITSKTIADLILTLRKESGCTTLTVTTDIQRAFQLGDRICLLARGRLTEGGSPIEVRNTLDPAFRQFVLGLKNGPLTSELV